MTLLPQGSKVENVRNFVNFKITCGEFQYEIAVETILNLTYITIGEFQILGDVIFKFEIYQKWILKIY